MAGFFSSDLYSYYICYSCCNSGCSSSSSSLLLLVALGSCLFRRRLSSG